MKILLALILSAALVHLGTPANEQINNSDQRVKAQAVQAEAPRKEPTAISQEKAQTEQQVDTEPETVAATPEPVKAQEPAPQPLTDHQTLMKQAGIAVGDFNATDYIVTKESTWCPY
ncbi:MAG TPA: hypothetical protein VLA77_05075, partial [Candidatus Saccharimonadales bacterium]|nr:hypothetical protein [Candidatus Saccharimonadales bacterium]